MKKETVTEMIRNENEVVIKAYLKIIKEHNFNFNEFEDIISITRNILHDHIHHIVVSFEKNTTTENSDVAPLKVFGYKFITINNRIFIMDKNGIIIPPELI